ncbi:hypothetical protein GCM10027089_17430 [Nocardia thraciensis]
MYSRVIADPDSSFRRTAGTAPGPVIPDTLAISRRESISTGSTIGAQPARYDTRVGSYAMNRMPPTP